MKIWLWAYLGPLFCLLASLLCLFLGREEASVFIALSVCVLPCIVLFRTPAFLGSALLLSALLFFTEPADRAWYGGLSALILSSGVLALLTLPKLNRPVVEVRAHAKKGWDRANVLEAHLKEAQKSYLEESSKLKGECESCHATMAAMKREHRDALNALRAAYYQGQLDLERLSSRDDSQSLKGELKQLRVQFEDKGQELIKARRERYELETRLLELEQKIEEEKVKSAEETFWVAPSEASPEQGYLEELVGDLLGELKSRCVPSHGLDLTLLGKNK